MTLIVFFFLLLNNIDLYLIFFSVDGAYCLTCGSDRKLKLWNPYRGVTLKTYGGHGDEVMDSSASCDSSQIVSCGLDKSVILWDVATGTPVRRLRGHAGPVNTVRYIIKKLLVPLYIRFDTIFSIYRYIFL